MNDEEKLALAGAYIAASRAGDTEAVVDLSEPDAVVWHNHDGLEVDVATMTRTLRWLHRTVPDVAWADVALTATSTGFVWEAVMTGSAPGGRLSVCTCVVVTVSPAGKIASIHEYLDRAALAPLTGG